jgi:hypothetical protein
MAVLAMLNVNGGVGIGFGDWRLSVFGVAVADRNDVPTRCAGTRSG